MRRLCLLLLLASPVAAEPAEGAGERAPQPRRSTGADLPTDSDSAAAEALQRALAELAHEPSVARVVKAARAAAPRGRSRALAARARAAGWVPRVGLRARRGQAVDLSSAQDGESLKLSTDDDLTLEASLTFDLDRVVFRREEVSLERQARAEREAHEERVREVIALYFERRRLQLEQRLHGATAERAARIAQLEAVLDLFTDGAFGRMIGDSGWTTGAGTPATKPKSSRNSSSAATR